MKTMCSTNLTQYIHLQCLCGCVCPSLEPLCWNWNYSAAKPAIGWYQWQHRSACRAITLVTVQAPGGTQGRTERGGRGGWGDTSCVKTHVSVAAEHAGEKRGWAVRSLPFSRECSYFLLFQRAICSVRKKNSKKRGATAACSCSMYNRDDLTLGEQQQNSNINETHHSSMYNLHCKYTILSILSI